MTKVFAAQSNLSCGLHRAWVIGLYLQPYLRSFSGKPCGANVLSDTQSTFRDIRIAGFAGLIEIMKERNVVALTLSGHLSNQQ